MCGCGEEGGGGGTSHHPFTPNSCSFCMLSSPHGPIPPASFWKGVNNSSESTLHA